jgi:hypothetical protein
MIVNIRLGFSFCLKHPRFSNYFFALTPNKLFSKSFENGVREREREKSFRICWLKTVKSKNVCNGSEKKSIFIQQFSLLLALYFHN